MRFENKIVLVLGGNSGMGLAAATAFAAEGGKVHLTGRDQATIDQAASSIPGSTGYRSDIADPSQLKGCRLSADPGISDEGKSTAEAVR